LNQCSKVSGKCRGVFTLAHNSDIYATVQKEKNRTTWVSALVCFNRTVDLKYGFTAEAQARAWCVEQIQKIITPKR